jgi:hypothetical protein
MDAQRNRHCRRANGQRYAKASLRNMTNKIKIDHSNNSILSTPKLHSQSQENFTLIPKFKE